MIALIRKNLRLWGYGKSLALFAGCILFSISGRLNGGIAYERHILSAVSDHYYLTYFVLPIVLLSCFSFIDDDGEPIILRFQSYHSYFLKKWIGVGLIAVILTAVQTGAILLSGIGLPLGNEWNLAAGTTEAELFSALEQLFVSPLQAFVCFTLFQLIGSWLIFGICMWIGHFTERKWTIRIVIVLYVLSAVWIKLPAIQNIPLTSFNHLLILHHNFGEPARPWITGFTLLLFMLTIMFSVRFAWRGHLPQLRLKCHGIIEYAYGRTVNTNAASIKLEDGNKKININSDTQYLVRSKDAKGNYVYTPYTKANLPQFEANSADIYYYVGADGIAKYVYVKNAVTEADFGTHIFVPTKGWYTTPVKNGIGTISVYVDGTQREVSAKADVIAYLAKNTGKMFHADWSKYTEKYDADTYGYITKVTLVNEPNDALDHDGYTCDYITYGDEDDNTIGEYVKKFVKNGLLYSPATGDNWNLTADTKFIGIDGEEFTSVDLNTLKEHDIWVIGNTTKGANYQDAKVVYVGQLLNKSVELDVTVSAKEGTIAVDKDDATKITFTSVNDVTSATLTLAAREGKDILNNVLTADNTVILGGDNSPALKHDTMAVTKAANTEPSTITVWNEAGTDSETYTIAYQWPVSEKTLAGAIVSITNNDASDVMASNKTGYATFASALANASKLEVGDATACLLYTSDAADD